MQKPNLLPLEFRPRPLVSWPRLFKTLVVINLMFSALFFYGIFFWELRDMESQVRNYNTLLANMASVQSTITEIDGIKMEIRRLTGLANSVKNNHILGQDFFADISRGLPEGLIFSQLTCAENNLTISGKANKKAEVVQYAQALRQMKWFKRVDIKTVTDNNGKAQYELTVVLAGEGGANSGKK